MSKRIQIAPLTLHDNERDLCVLIFDLVFLLHNRNGIKITLLDSVYESW